MKNTKRNLRRKHSISRKKKSTSNRKKSNIRKKHYFSRKNINYYGGDPPPPSAPDEFILKVRLISDELLSDIVVNNNDSTNTIMNRLKSILTMNNLREAIIAKIAQTNRGRTRNLMKESLSCWETRELYITLIQTFVRKWMEIMENNKNFQATGLGASYIRWISRITSRSFTNTDKLLTRYMCNPAALEVRDARTYPDCIRGEPCPTLEYLARRLELPMDDIVNPKWLDLVESALRDNNNVTFQASVGRMLDI